jgi:ketosteroid isomerase-like protein
LAVHGRDNLEREQWRDIWPRIRGFAFDPHPVVRADGDTAWIAAGWHSEATGPDGKPFTRPGCATLSLARRDGHRLCVHGHVSLQPTQSESANGRFGA